MVASARSRAQSLDSETLVRAVGIESVENALRIECSIDRRPRAVMIVRRYIVSVVVTS